MQLVRGHAVVSLWIYATENWDIRDSFTRTAPLLGGFNLRKLASLLSPAAAGSSGVEFLTVTIAMSFPATTFTSAVLSQGYQLKHMADLNFELSRVPEKRFVTTAAVLRFAGPETAQKIKAISIAAATGNIFR